MRLGSRPTNFVEKHKKQSKAYLLYGQQASVNERHRHRYEVNPDYIERLENAGLHFVGQDDTYRRMEIIEIPDHPFFVAAQYHPEYTSRPLSPSPLFLGFVLASGGLYEKYVQEIDNMASGIESPIAERIISTGSDDHLGRYTPARNCASPFMLDKHTS